MIVRSLLRSLSFVALVSIVGLEGCTAGSELVPGGRRATNRSADATDPEGDEAALKSGADGNDPATVVDPKPTATDFRIADAKLEASGATAITLVWSAVKDATGYRIERAPAAAGAPGAWEPLGLLPSPTTESFVDPKKLTADSFYRIVTLSAKGESESSPVAAFPIAKTTYSIPGVRLPGLTAFNVEISGTVRHPKSTAGKRLPLVLMMHGNHEICRTAARGDYCPPDDTRSSGNVPNACTDGGTTIPNHLGYVYLLETLAAQGYVAVSVDANALTCRNSSLGFIAQRTQLFLEHMRRWKTFTTTGAPAPLGSALVGAVDLTRVGIMGHSRGGEAAAGVPQAIAATPIAGVSVKSVVPVAPTDFAETSKPSSAALSVVLPLCDGDVWENDGMFVYDRIRHDRARTAPLSQVAIVGANHNYFNDVWTSDDNATNGKPTRTCSAKVMLGQGEAVAAKRAQRAVLALHLSDWYAATLRGGVEVPAYLRGEADLPSYFGSWTGAQIDLRASYSGASHEPVDDFSLATTAARKASGYAKSLACAGSNCDLALGVCSSTRCNGQVGRCTSPGCELLFQNFHRPAVVKAFALSWSTPTASMVLDLADADIATRGALSFRAAVADSPLNPAGANVDFRIEVADVAGKKAALDLAALARLPRLYATRVAGDVTSDVYAPKEIFQTIRITKDDLAGIDVAHVKTLTFAMNGAPKGAVFITDVEITD